jgi:hypothetical protein
VPFGCIKPQEIRPLAEIYKIPMHALEMFFFIFFIFFYLFYFFLLKDNNVDTFLFRKNFTYNFLFLIIFTIIVSIFKACQFIVSIFQFFSISTMYLLEFSIKFYQIF